MVSSEKGEGPGKLGGESCLCAPQWSEGWSPQQWQRRASPMTTRVHCSGSSTVPRQCSGALLTWNQSKRPSPDPPLRSALPCSRHHLCRGV